MECNENRKSDKVVIADTLEGAGHGSLESYLTHAICLEGESKFSFNGNDFTFKRGDLLITRKGQLIENLVTSPDFKVKVIYIDKGFIELATPNTNYGMRGTLALFLNPVMHLTEFQFELCKENFKSVEFRHNATCYRYYEEGLRCAIQLMVLDFLDFHARNYQEDGVSNQSTAVISKFLSMLEDGEYRNNREVSHYASALCVTPKYLSEVCKKASGHSANFWINRYTILDITRLLRKKEHTFVEISDLFNFSSPAYFSRYVQRYLGMNPTDYRE